MNFAPNRPALQDAAQTPHNPRDSWPAWTDARIGLGPVVPPAESLAPRWRSIAVTTRGLELDRADGHAPGLVEDLIRLALDAHRLDRAESSALGEPLADLVATSGDQAIWDGNRLAAVLRVLADGSMQVARFAPAGPLVDECSRPRVAVKGVAR